MRWAEPVALGRQEKCIQDFSGGKRPLGRFKRRWDNNNKIVFHEMDGGSGLD
jgi:hypothetical protein